MKARRKAAKVERVPKAEQVSAIVRSAAIEREAYVAELFQHPELRGAARQIAGLRRDTSRHLVDVGLEVGQLLARSRERLKGLFQRWVKERLPIDPRTAGNQLSLARAAAEEPNFVEDWKDLGLSKLYRLARLTPRARQKVFRAPHLDTMGDKEFARLLRPHQSAAARDVTPRMHAHGLRMKLQAWTIKTLAFRVPQLDRVDREALRVDFQDLITALDDHAKKLR